MQFVNDAGLPVVDGFIRLFGPELSRMFAERDVIVVFKILHDSENDYRDIIARLGNTVYLSVSEVGELGLTDPEIFAALTHEIGHIMYGSQRFGIDAETRADSLAAELGLANQMISVIDKVIMSRRFPRLTSQLVCRIQYLQHLA